MQTDVSGNVKRIIRDYIKWLASDNELADDADLRGLGLDSMQANNLMIELEEEFSINFPDSMLVPDTFKNAKNLIAAVESLISTD